MGNNELYFFLGAACVPALHYAMVRLLCLVTLGAVNSFRYRRALTALLSAGMGVGVYMYAAFHGQHVPPELAAGIIFAGLVWVIYCAFADIKAPREKRDNEQKPRSVGKHSPEY